MKQSLKEFTEGYANLKPIVQSLTEHENTYLAALKKIHKICGGTVTEWNDELYNTILFEQIQRFETENRTLMSQVASFEKVVAAMEKELVVETMVKAIGFSDAVVTVSSDFDSVNVFIDTPELTYDSALSIYTTLKNETGISPEKIRIVPINSAD